MSILCDIIQHAYTQDLFENDTTAYLSLALHLSSSLTFQTRAMMDLRHLTLLLYPQAAPR